MQRQWTAVAVCTEEHPRRADVSSELGRRMEHRGTSRAESGQRVTRGRVTPRQTHRVTPRQTHRVTAPGAELPGGLGGLGTPQL